MSQEQVPPHSDEVEQAVLGAVLIYPEILTIVSGSIPGPEAFYLNRNRAVYEAMLGLQASGTEIDIRTLSERLKDDKAYDTAGGMTFLSALDLHLPDSSRSAIERYAGVLKDRWAKREIIAAAIGLREAAHNGQPAPDIVAEYSRRIEEISREMVADSNRRNFGEFIRTYDAYDRSPPARGLRIGFPDVDVRLGGLFPGELTVLAASPRVGKTSFALQVAAHAARQGSRVLYYSLEMMAPELHEVMLAQASMVNRFNILTGNLTDQERVSLDGAANEMACWADRLEHDESSSLTIDQVRASAAVYQLRHGLDLVIIDSLGYLRSPRHVQDMVEELGARTLGAKNLAKELKVSVLLIHHPNRSPAKDKRPPQLEDLRDSGKIEQWADNVHFLYRPEVNMAENEPGIEAERGKAYFCISKARKAQAGMIEMVWDGPTQRFACLSDRPQTF